MEIEFRAERLTVKTVQLPDNTPVARVQVAGTFFPLHKDLECDDAAQLGAHLLNFGLVLNRPMAVRHIVNTMSAEMAATLGAELLGYALRTGGMAKSYSISAMQQLLGDDK